MSARKLWSVNHKSMPILRSYGYKNRTCILARKQINPFLLSTYSDMDQTVVRCEQRGLPSLIIATMYQNNPFLGPKGEPGKMEFTDGM